MRKLKEHLNGDNIVDYEGFRVARHVDFSAGLVSCSTGVLISLVCEMVQFGEITTNPTQIQCSYKIVT